MYTFYFLAISEWGHLDATSSFTLCLVGWILGGVENIGRKMGWKSGFSSVWYWVENRRVENLGEKFLSGPTKFFLPNQEEKAREENCVPAILLECPPINPSFKTFTYPTEDFCPKWPITFSHLLLSAFSTPSTVPGSLLSLFVFFFFNFFSFNVIYCCL